MASLIEEAPRFFGYYNLIFLGQAFAYTALLSLVGCGLGFLVGFGLAVLRNERIVGFAPLRWFATIYVEIFRRIPFLVKLMVVFFAFQLAGLDASMFAVAATTVALSASAFSAENIRAGLESVHRNQWDAAETMNMGGLTALRRVILPQAWAIIIPPSMTYSVGLVKSTSIASQIGVVELTYAAKILNQKGFSAAICFGTILILYFVLCYPLNLFASHLERRLAPSRHR
ncbi:MAG: amino acid ABC transporter permease [Bosea sp. (in: a-proteobacteria)]|jgi:polar amino acid transport system permease protein|uniref:amino acid ABC transporter permease n=1 Tax=Bosea sp. (in: a-proteobacteria) TaxID=1871050 RepID=UPI000B2973CF|nr:amino acid ABC transporter permease [Bosea sp. (in: a-proteobacteria)]MBA4333439.1 amino acid ABC transporter permease [Methylobacterium sp.]MCZ8044268.1 amino acid ABC transporter permease [Beijerinckiaceae bacterium]MDP3600382.1 amino acid ABC transporter permease [Bosea sp. (in: a-proteobacteria)]WRH60528.1 MAG: amino acid ABC transporter permease [Bosea sp. (in: a-proteobacteria)]